MFDPFVSLGPNSDVFIRGSADDRGVRSPVSLHQGRFFGMLILRGQGECGT